MKINLSKKLQIKNGIEWHQSRCLMRAKHALYHLSYYPLCFQLRKKYV